MALLRVPGLAMAGNGELSEEDLDRVRELLGQVATEALES